jgi:hypothetical protein
MSAGIDGIINEPTVNFVGKDGFFWWVGEVEDNEDPMELGRVKVRVLGYYTNVRGGTTADLPTKNLPWATVLQHTSQAGNDGQGESSGQLQPGAIVMGFFMDGESAQMPIVIGVLRVTKSADSRDTKKFAFTGENMEPGVAPNTAALKPGAPNSQNASTSAEGYRRQSDSNIVAVPGQKTTQTGGPGSPRNLGSEPGVNGSSANPHKPRNPTKPIPAANGVGGPWKTLEYKLSYLIEDIGDTAGSLIKAEDGDFIDVVTGKLVTAKALTAKLQNFLSAVFTQVVAAIRESLANLAEELELVNLLGGATGAPFVIFTAIQSAVTTILSSLCSVDAQLMSFIQDPIGSLLGIVESFLEGAISKAQMVLQGVQEVIDRIVCQVQSLLDTALSIVDTVASIVKGVQEAQEVLDAWKAGSDLFAEGADLFAKGITSLSGLIALFVKFASGNCNRSPDGGADTVGYYPLFGVTHCTEEELEEINKIRGLPRGECGGGDGGNIIDSILKEADPYLTAATTYISGAYDLHVGTPGRQVDIKKEANGTTSTSVKINNAVAAEDKHIRELRKKKEESGTTLTPEEETSARESYKKQNNSGKGDTGNFVADNKSYAGNYTSEVHGDRCETVDKNKVVNIEGDYHLNITGDCHVSVGGGFFFTASGAPKVVDDKGESKNTKIQKHTIKFDSDVDMSVVGARYKLQAAEMELASQSTKLTGAKYENSSTSQTMSGGDLVLTANNTINMSCPKMYEFINFPPAPGILTSGKFIKCGGSIDIIQKATTSATDAVPRFTITNPEGAYTATFGLTHVTTATGAITATTAGPLVLSGTASATLKSEAAVTITAGAACVITGATIKLN